MASIIKKNEDTGEGRGVWSTRIAFIMAGCGSAIGLGNMLRYPSQVYNNYGVQWFIPYLICLFIVGIPLLLLEIALGQVYRSSAAVAFGRVNPRFIGFGFGLNINAFIVATYYNVLVAWVVIFMGRSFQTPLPWIDTGSEAFFFNEIVANAPSLAQSDGIVWVTLLTAVLVWILVFFIMFKGVGLMGRLSYFMMGAPVLMLFVILGRGVSLDNAWEGIKLYIGTWRGETLAQPRIWQNALGQIFFSIGVGFGTYIAYASYNPKNQNAVIDALTIGISNSLYEIIAGFAAFGVVGFLQFFPQPGRSLSTFSLGFITYPTALAELPGANAWAVIFFFTLFLLGLTSSIALNEPLVTMLSDSRLLRGKAPRWMVVGGVTLLGILASFIYASEFGLEALDYVDGFTNDFALPFIACAETFAVGAVYRSRDVSEQLGKLPPIIFNVAYILALALGNLIAYTTADVVNMSNLLGMGIGFGVFFIGLGVAVAMSKTPTVSLGIQNEIARKLYWLTLYSVDQFRKDLNAVVAADGRVSIPFVWGVLLRYAIAPICFIISCFKFPTIVANANNPLAVFGFCVGCLCILSTAAGLIFTRFWTPLLPLGSEDAWRDQYSTSPGVVVTPSAVFIEQEAGIEVSKASGIEK